MLEWCAVGFEFFKLIFILVHPLCATLSGLACRLIKPACPLTFTNLAQMLNLSFFQYCQDSARKLVDI